MGYTHYWDNAHTKAKPETVKVFKKHFNEMFRLMGGEKVISIDDNSASQILFNGVGEYEHESMQIDFTGDGSWGFCKTARKPYDRMVVACLILAKEMGIIKDWSSDGDDENGDFDAGMALLAEVKNNLLTLEPALNHYWVELKLQIGELEKSGYALVVAANEKDAGKFALVLECHGNAKFETDDVVYDMGGGMAYSIRKVIKLPKSQVEVLKQHFDEFTYNEETINAMMGV